MSDELVELRVVGVTDGTIHGEAFVVLLEQVDGPYRLPIVVGRAEAVAIAMRIQDQIPPRPATHDLFTSMMHAFGILLERVVIHSFDGGVFSAVLQLSSNAIETELDTRPSDAIAIALRVGAPIFITRSVFERTAYSTDKDGNIQRMEQDDDLQSMSLSRLRERLQHYVEREQYEQAAQVQRIIKQREESQA